MRSDPELDVARRRWAATAAEHLTAVVDAAVPLRKAFDADAEIAPAIGAVLASEVINACSVLTDWLTGVRAPKGLGKAEGELGAVAGVYRNAAVAFRSLADAEIDQLEARSTACATMLDQGDHHVGIFIAILEKKVGVQGRRGDGQSPAR
ncbi:MAG TPA: hypothetical protein VNG12_22585 [Acidimicrobiales bacterium]|nr:hypothetical protein [Acidimicrobiales bacterium]